jgi:hypothetical protein
VPWQIYRRVPWQIYRRMPWQIYRRVPWQIYRRVPWQIYRRFSRRVPWEGWVKVLRPSIGNASWEHRNPGIDELENFICLWEGQRVDRFTRQR